MSSKEIEVIEEQCPKCGSLHTDFDESENFYECNVCKNVWAYDRDDPDYEDFEKEDDFKFDCGFYPGYGCSYAGSEDCDFECPYSRKLHAHPNYPNVALTDF